MAADGGGNRLKGYFAPFPIRPQMERERLADLGEVSVK